MKLQKDQLFFTQYYKKIGISPPLCHFVLGSGFSEVFEKLKKGWTQWSEKASCLFKEVPGLPSATVKSHAGQFRFFEHKKSKKTISFQCGRLHLYEGHSAQTVVQPVREIALAGTQQFVLSNISGGLKPLYEVGSIFALKDQVNFTGLSPLTGPEKSLVVKDKKGNKRAKKIGHRFPDMSRVYSPDINDKIFEELDKLSVWVRKGVYVGVQGPELETPAYIQWLRTSSGGLFDLVGMSTVLEAIALKQAGAKLGGFSVVSNPASGVREDYEELSFAKMCKNIEPSVKKLLKAYISYSEKYLIP